MAKQYLNGKLIDMTNAEITVLENERQLYQSNSFDRAMQELRAKRNSKLAETDYLALSDQTLSADMNTYRQNLRDITNGLTTVEEVNAVVFPEKPEV